MRPWNPREALYLQFDCYTKILTQQKPISRFVPLSLAYGSSLHDTDTKTTTMWNMLANKFNSMLSCDR